MPTVKYPKVRNVTVLPDQKLRVTFANDEVRIYDCKPLLAEQPFARLANNALFGTVQADPHGYGIVWSDEIDLSESELWLNGVPERTKAPRSR